MKTIDLEQIRGGQSVWSPILRRLGLFQVVLFLLAFPLQAQERGQEGTLDPITVKATRTKQRLFDLPSMNSVIDLDRPNLVFPSNLSDIFSSEPWLDFVKSARRNGQSPVMRGYDEAAIITLFDGVRQNFDSAHDGKFFIDSSLVKRVEVLRGPNSALYGSGGLGGVISFETKDAADLLKPGQNFGTLLSSGYQSVNAEELASFSAFGRAGNLDLLGTLSWRKSGDIALPGDVEPLPSDDTLTSGLFKLGWSPREHHTFRLGFQGYRNNAIEPNEPQGLRPDLAVLAADVNKDTTSYTTRVAYEYSNPQQPWLEVETQFFSTETRVQETFTEDVVSTGPPPVRTLAKKGDVLVRDLKTNGLNVGFQSSFGKKEDLKSTFSYGIEYYNDTQEGSDDTNTGMMGSLPAGLRGGVPDAEAKYLGLYLQNELSLPTTLGEFLFIPGVRYDKYDSTHDSRDGMSGVTTKLENEDEETSAKFGVTYKPLEWLMFFGNYAQAFRAPTLSELYVRGSHFSLPEIPANPIRMTPFFPGGNNLFVPNPDLESERSTNTEGGIGFRFQDLLLNEDALKIKVSYFGIKSEDYIDQSVNLVRSPTLGMRTGTCCGTTISVNVPEAELWGWEAELKYDSSRVNLNFAYSYINGVVRKARRQGEEGNFLANLTPDKYTSDVSYKLREIASVFGIRIQIARPHDRVPPATDDDRSTPGIDEREFPDETRKRNGYVVYNLYYQLRPKSAWEGLTFKFGIDNVGDKEYSRIYAGSLEPGRNYKAGLSYQW